MQQFPGLSFVPSDQIESVRAGITIMSKDQASSYLFKHMDRHGRKVLHELRQRSHIGILVPVERGDWLAGNNFYFHHSMQAQRCDILLASEQDPTIPLCWKDGRPRIEKCWLLTVAEDKMRLYPGPNTIDTIIFSNHVEVSPAQWDALQDEPIGDLQLVLLFLLHQLSSTSSLKQ